MSCTPAGIALPHLHALVRACAPEGAALHCLVLVLVVWTADTPERVRSSYDSAALLERDDSVVHRAAQADAGSLTTKGG
jgi:hypothetical protein